MDPRLAFAKGLRGYVQDPDYLARRNKRMYLKNKQQKRNNSLGGASILSSGLAVDPLSALPGRMNGSLDIASTTNKVLDDLVARNRGVGDSGDGFGGSMAQALKHEDLRIFDERKTT